MCGILGYNTGVDSDIPSTVQAHRGPDYTGVGQFGAFTFCHNRLSIIDLSPESNQPFVSADGRYVIVFNGEIYNYQDLRGPLAAKYPFRTNSDTEVLLYSYIEYGEACLDQLLGMFAFAIYDTQLDRLFCARDRLGVKPFVYYYADGKFAFASEINGVLSVLPERPKMSPVALSQYLTYLYVPAPLTMFQGVFKLPPAHSLVLEKGELTITCYWELPKIWAPGSVLGADVVGTVDALLEDAVRLRMIADVPLGAFLSGGLDSSTIVYYMSQLSTRPVKTFTLGFHETRYDERSDARIIATQFQTDHEEIMISPDSASLLPMMVSHFGEPFGNPTALLIYELTKYTKPHVTVALVGDGGDEVFGGYPRYRGMGLADALRWVPDVIKSGVSWGVGLLGESVSGRHGLRRLKEFATTLSLSPSARYEVWVGYFGEAELATMLRHPVAVDRPVRQMWEQLSGDAVSRGSGVDLMTFLPSNLLAYGDAMSMANAFEVRFPFLDHRLVAVMATVGGRDRFRGGYNKVVMRQVMAGRLPDSILAKPKLGLNPPMGLWLKSSLSGLMNDYLSEAVIQKRGLFHYGFIVALLADFESGRRDVSLQIWALMVLEEWMRQYVD